MKKIIVLLTVSALVLAMAPAAQAEVIDSYSINVTSTTVTADYISPLHILNPDGLAVTGSGTGPYTYEAGTAGAVKGLISDRHWTDHNGSGQFQSNAGQDPETAWLKFDLGQNYYLDQLRVWNGDYFRAPNGGPVSGDPEPNPRFSAKQTDLYYSSAAGDPGDDFNTGWTLIGTAGALELSIPTLFSGGVSGGDWEATDEIALNGIDARWFAMKVNSTHGQPWFRIAEVQFIEGVQVFDFVPTPAHGATGIPFDSLTLSWLNLPVPTTGSALVEVFWDTGEAGDDETQPLTLLTPNSANVTPAADNTTYHWKIVATDPGTSLVLEEAVFSLTTENTNVAPTITVTPLDFGYVGDYVWLEGDPKETTFAITATVDDPDGDTDHIYTWSSSPAGVDFSNPASLSTNVTFDTAGDYILEVEVDDEDGEYTDTDTVNVHVYENGCVAAKAKTPYTKADARIIGDTNYDCDVDLVDLAAMASHWLQ